MIVELSIIKAFLIYKTWEDLSSNISSKDFPEDLQLLYRTLDSFHKTNNDQKDLHLYDLANLFFSNNIRNKEFYEDIFANIESYEPNLDTVTELVVSLKRSKALRELSIASYEAAEGKKSYEELLPLIEVIQKPSEIVVEDTFASDDLSELVNTVYKEGGLTFRLECLRRSVGPLRKGDFGFIFARPETGKTTFFASEEPFFAEQLKEGDGPILHLNNEEEHNKVKFRIVQGAFGITKEELMGNIPKYQKLYNDKYKGKIKLPLISTYHRSDITRLFKKYKPSLVVMDQIDKVVGFKADREDLHLGAIYQWFRDMAKEYCPVIAVCQSDATGENKKWLTMENVANAKTAKQAEADWIMGIGKIHDTGWEKVRFLHLSKNKLMGDSNTDEELRHGKMEVLIEPTIARYKDFK